MEKLEFRLGYDTDIIKVKKIIRKIGEELMAHPEIGPQLLQPLKSQGVMAMEGSRTTPAPTPSVPSRRCTRRR